MKTSELTNELDAALSLFQGEMPVIKKDVNVKMKGFSKSGKEFSVDYDYAPLESIQEKANPLLSKHGLNVSQDIGFIFKPDGDLLHVIETRVGHKSGQWKLSSWPLDMSGVGKEQDRGSKITFNKRYAFVASLNIALSDEDNDAVDVKIVNKLKSDTTNFITGDLGNAQIMSGNLKGKAFNSIPKAELKKYYDNSIAYFTKDGAEIKGALKLNLDQMKEYLNT